MRGKSIHDLITKPRRNAGLVLLPFAIIMMLLPACSAKDGREKNNNSVKFDQYYIQGEELYLNHCSNCHQKDGSGLGLIYPPLYQSDFIDNNFTKVICLIRHGQRGEIIVNGKNFNKEMPAIPTLTDLEIAEIATYIYNTWSHQRGIVAVKEVSVILSTCQKDSTSAHK